MWVFFKASIYFYLFEDFSIVLIIVFSAGILPEPEKRDRLQLTKQRDIPIRLQLPIVMGQILPLTVPPFTWKYLIRKSLGEPAWVLGKVSDKHHPNRQPQQPLGGKANDWTETWIKPLCYSRKLLQLAKFALPPSFGETAQAREKTLLLLPRRAGECTTSSITEFIAPEGQSMALRPGLGCLSELRREKGMSAVQMLWSCTTLWELAWNSNPQRVPSASTSAKRVLGAIKAMLPTDSKGIWDHFVTSFHFIWCQRCGSLQSVFSSSSYSARTNECAYIFFKSQSMSRIKYFLASLWNCTKKCLPSTWL